MGHKPLFMYLYVTLCDEVAQKSFGYGWVLILKFTEQNLSPGVWPEVDRQYHSMVTASDALIQVDNSKALFFLNDVRICL